MEKISITILVVMCSLISNELIAQEKPIVRKGLIRSQLTISPANMLDYSVSPFYFHGSLEGFLTKNTSIAGEGYFSLGEISGEKTLFDFNHSTFFGGAYHFSKDNSSFHIGIQPGVSFSRIRTTQGHKKGDMGISPLFSSVVGYHFFVHKFFHFFVQSRVILGQHLYNKPVSLNEFRFSAGLGFNLNALK